MDLLQIIYNVFSLLGGLAIFLVGMKFMGNSLEAVAGDKMKKMFEKISDNRFKGFAIGAAATAVVQSSSATSVMVIGFVNVGFLTLYQAIPILLGSIVGTTVTAQLTSLSAFNITAIMSLVAGCGAFLYLFGKNDKLVHVGEILLGFGMLFIGLSLMSSSMKILAFNSDGSPTVFATALMNFENPLLCVLLMTFFTAVIQSSSASTSVMVALGTAGVLTNPAAAMYMVLGTHIGTTITGLLASFGANVSAKRTAVINTMIGVIGTIFWFLVLTFFSTPIGNIVMALSGSMERFIANFHTISNLIAALLMLPFIKQLADLGMLIVPDPSQQKKEDDIKRLHYLDERILSTPSLAVAQSLAEVKNMADLAQYNLINSIDMILNLDLSKQEKLAKNEAKINYLNLEITNYLVKFSALDLSQNDNQIIGSLFHVASDIERIGDYAENVMQFAEQMVAKNLSLSNGAKLQLEEAKAHLKTLYADAMETFTKRDKSLLAKVDITEKAMDDLKVSMETKHVARMEEGRCSAEVGAIFLSLASQLERVADHMTNIAYSVLPFNEKILIEKTKKN
ncbi:MAG: Na/Pi cotransporter family protein [Clostridia bacterium]|nr:Na/Pi cotransporter family protein [Clostridia bacterium]